MKGENCKEGNGSGKILKLKMNVSERNLKKKKIYKKKTEGGKEATRKGRGIKTNKLNKLK